MYLQKDSFSKKEKYVLFTPEPDKENVMNNY